MNTLSETGSELIPVDYTDILKKLTRVVKEDKENSLLAWNSNRKTIAINADSLAEQFAITAKSEGINDPLIGNGSFAQAATVNFSSATDEKFSKYVRHIRSAIRQRLKDLALLHSPEQTLPEFLSDMPKPLTEFNTRGNTFGLGYNFDRQEQLEKQRLTLRQSVSSPTTTSTSATNQRNQTPLLGFHRLSITVKTGNGGTGTGTFDEQLMTGLQGFINNRLAKGITDEDQRDDLLDLLTDLRNDRDSDLIRLRDLVNKEGLGKLKKEAKLCGFEYFGKFASADDSAKVYLDDLIRRLRSLDKYINRDDLPDDHFEIGYAGQGTNLRNQFAREDAFDTLPIIPYADGHLGETTDENKGEITFVFGLKVKLNGKVQNRRGSQYAKKDEKDIRTFEYYLERLYLPDRKSAEGHGNGKRDQSRGHNVKEISFERVFLIAALYFWVFSEFGNLDYNPQTAFEEGFLKIVREGSDQEKRELVRSIRTNLLQEWKMPVIRGKETQDEDQHLGFKLMKLRALFKSVLKRQTQLPTVEYPVHMSVRNGILRKDYRQILRESSFFQPELRDNPKQALKYLLVGEAQADRDSLIKLRATITISNSQFCNTGEKQKFVMRSVVDDTTILPVLIVPRHKDIRKVYDYSFGELPAIIMAYNHDAAERIGSSRLEGFCYRFAHLLLSYICLKVIVEELNDPKLFLPIVRLHLEDTDSTATENSEEKFASDLSKILTHLLGEDCRVNSQGFNVRELAEYLKIHVYNRQQAQSQTRTDQAKTKTSTVGSGRSSQAQPQPQHYNFTVPNGLTSLYSVLPRQFDFTTKEEMPRLDKLAVIVVSARKCDNQFGKPHHISTLLGEVIGVERVGEKSVRVQPLRTFSGNYDSTTLFSHPTVLLDEVTRLYKEGYRHCVYIAKSPYSSTLHLTRKSESEDDELFFLSHSIIKELKHNKPDLKIYPVFFDKYYVVRLTDPKTSSLYIHDIHELSQLVQDPAKHSVIFFNLFNGRVVGSQEERQYNGVVSYSTLLNMYKNILDDQEIREGLIVSGPLRESILQYLLLLHFARFEGSRDITLKLDPYQNIIGTEAVGTLGIFPHIAGQAKFNALAFLTEVRRVLNIGRNNPASGQPNQNQSVQTQAATAAATATAAGQKTVEDAEGTSQTQ
jgi:hypothetical protein